MGFTFLPVSDLHVDHHADGGIALVASLAEADALVIAGDLTESDTLFPALELCCARYADVIFVPGNHEFYFSSLEDLPRRLACLRVRLANRGQRLHVLINRVLELGGLRFVGTTLWVRRVVGIERLHSQMNDFRYIKGADPQVYEANEKAVAFLEGNVRSGDVVITHHAPSADSISTRYAGNPLNPMYVCDMESLMADRDPDLWIHGHMHHSVDYFVSNTRVISNPFGYVGETNSRFRGDLVVEVVEGRPIVPLPAADWESPTHRAQLAAGSG